MGFMDEMGSLVGQSGEMGDRAKVAGGLMEALGQHPGGIQGVIDSFRQNGMEQHVNAWGSGEQQTATPEQVQQGLGGTGLIERTAQNAGVSPEVVQMAMATILPMVIRHFAPGGQVAPQGEGQFGGMAQQLLSRFL
ncbi:YidB family protein [Granulicella arctica]|uniref:YidB family protein n=1 Tax=Granulicella arctica TaxID=940613 RepID=UPI0021DFD75D|nr:YidB family protein [Granulicella arctica]